MKTEGFIKLHRRMSGNPLFQANPLAKHVFRDIIEQAEWQDTTREWRGPVVVRRGETMISTRRLAELTGFSHQKIRTILRKLASHNMIKINTLGGNGPMVISVCNYDKYQGLEHATNTPANTPSTHAQHTSKEGEEKEEGKNTSDPNGSLVAHGEGDPDLLGDPIKAKKSKSQPIAEAFNAYNATAERCGLRQATQLSPARRKSIGARLREVGFDGWQNMLANVERSAFLTGSNDREWRVDLDWLIKPKNFTKVSEGTYGNGRHAENDPADDWAVVAEQLRQQGYSLEGFQ